MTHSRCTRCFAKKEQALTSEKILKRFKDKINTSDSFPWRFDDSRVDPEKLYSSKTLLPLICKTCNSTAEHSSSNIQTFFQRPGHLACQVCKVRKAWKEKTEKRSNGEFELDIIKAEKGFKITHQKCRFYYYANTPNLIRNYSCPICTSKPNSIIGKLRDEEQVKEFFKIKTNDRLSFHGFDFKTRVFSVSCKEHPEQGIYELSWKSFQITKKSSNIFCCKICRRQRLRTITIADYNEKINPLYLKVTEIILGKITMDDEFLHQCTKYPYHPPFKTSPYEVIIRKKGCKFCAPSTSYHKDFDFIKNYVEMDEDRFFTHSGRQFRLLSTRKEVESQIQPFKSLSSVKIRINELTCSLHNEFEVTWGSFCYRHSSCGKCTNENTVSYAHIYYRALLDYFKLDYIPEYPIRINERKRYRVDFKLTTLPNFLEIDSSLHAGKGWDGKYSKQQLIRDARKNILLKDNLERLKLYDDKNRVLPVNTQLYIIEEAFIKRLEKNGIIINKEAIEAAKKDPSFFRNSKLEGLKRRLARYHGAHIEFAANEYVDMIQALGPNETEFFCSLHKEKFSRKFYSILKAGFICPVCTEKIRSGQQDNYWLTTEKINLISEEVTSRFRKRFDLKVWQETQTVFYFSTVVFPVYDNYKKKQLYFPLKDLISEPVEKVIENISNGKYLRYTIITSNNKRRNRTIDNEKIPIIKTSKAESDNRLIYNTRSEMYLAQYQKSAKYINKIMKGAIGDAHIDQLIAQNESSFKIYFHKSEKEARAKLAVYDRKIVPFFNQNVGLELHTCRNKYANNKQNLLIKDLNCGHFFYVSWNWITIRKRNGKSPVQCQRHDCFRNYYLSTNNNCNKISQENILNLFKTLFNGQYYPVCPDQKILIRNRTLIQHIPSGKLLLASIDNFRRGKFKCEFKNKSLDELKKRFPLWEK